MDLTIEDSLPSHQSLQVGEWALAHLRTANGTIRPGDLVEVRNIKIGTYRVGFVLVKIIASSRTGEGVIRGEPFLRCDQLGGKLPIRLNEICRITLLDQNDDNNASPALVEVPLASLVKKREFFTTNAVLPTHGCEDYASIRDEDLRQRTAEEFGRLVHRWNFTIYSVTHGRASKPVEEVLERVCAEEVTESRYRELDDRLCSQWRGGRIVGGSWCPERSSQPLVETIEIDAPEIAKSQASSRYRSRGQKYTVFDSFSGAGGVTRGAQMAGFKVTHAVDKAPEVWPTYKYNFGETKLFKGAIDGFIKRYKRHVRADILHLSPPCQYFSPAHTHDGPNDEENIFALFSCSSLIDKVRPRIITVEQTFGITHDRHQQYLRTLIGDFTQFGYSVRWKVVRLSTWGSAQDRKRLIIIASAPGEKLAPFPRPTHSQDGIGGLKPFVTIRQALGAIKPYDTLHDTRSVKQHVPRRAPYDPNRLAGTLTTGGADFAYPDGTRDFTLREMASLQGFPTNHQFIGNRTSVKRQIGNAFPPNTVKVLYRHLERWLLKQDGMLPYRQPATDTIVIDEPGWKVTRDRSTRSSTNSSSSSRSSSGARRPSPEMIELIELCEPMDIDDEPRAGGEHVDRTCMDVIIDLT